MGSHSGTPNKLVIPLALSVIASAAAGEPVVPNPFVAEIPSSCAVVEQAALKVFKHSGVNMAACGTAQGDCTHFIDSDHVRSASGHLIFNFTGRYVKGGKWYSPLMSPNATGWTGEMALTPKNQRECELSLEITFRTTVASGGGYSFSGSGPAGATHVRWADFVPAPGPGAQSNGRLEREYARTIAAVAAGHH